jgi:hypothetical protein
MGLGIAEFSVFWLDYSGLYVPIADFCEQGSELSGSLK